MKAIVHQEEDRTKAIIASLLFHAALMAILIFYTFQASPPVTEVPAIVLDMGGGGDNAALGSPDEGQGDDPAPQGQQMEDPSSTETVDNPSESSESSSPPPSSTPPVKSDDGLSKNTTTGNDPEAAAIKKRQDDARKAQEEQDRIRREQENQQRIADAERQRKAQEEADRKRREQEELDKKKGKFGSSFGSGSGGGRGNTGKPGNQGQPDGTGDNPFGKSAGSGGGTGGGTGTGTGSSVGGGLGGRKALSKAAPDDTSQKAGKVRVEVCVNADGKVISADFTLSGSTTSDSELKSKAVAAAKKWRFEPSSSDKQCGWIDFNFRLK